MALVANEEFQHILRVLNTNVDGKRKIMYALTSIKGVGRRFANISCKKADADMNKRAGELSAEELENTMTVVANPLQFKIPQWFLNRKKDYKDGRYSQVVSNVLDMKLRDDLERLKNIRLYSTILRQSELKNENEEGKFLGEEASLFNKLSDDVPRDANPQEASEKGLSAKIGIIVKSFEKPKYFGAFGVPTDKNRVKLPTTRTLITVLRSPHIDKKSREQFEMKIRREYIIIKCQPHELQKKYFWFKRTRILGAQIELVFSYKTRLDMGRLKASM